MPPNLAALKVQYSSSIRRELGVSRIVSPRHHHIAILQGRHPAHGARVDTPRVEVLPNDLCGLGPVVKLEVQATGVTRLFLRAEVCLLAVVVEEGDVAGVGRVEAGVVLPAKVGRAAIAEVDELVELPAEEPERMAVGRGDEGDEGEVAGGDEVVAVRGLRHVSQRVLESWAVER